MTGAPDRALRPLAWTTPVPPEIAPPRRLSMTLGILSLILQLTVSANLLYILGIHYQQPGGNPIVKINPATYVALLALLVRLCETGDPLGALVRLFAAYRLVAVFLLAMVVILVYSAASIGLTGTAGVIDSYMSAGILVLVLHDASRARRRVLGAIMLALILLNVTIAVGETVAQRHIMPLYLNGSVYRPRPGDFRGVALYDHPLTGAMMTSMGLFLLLQMRLRLRFTLPLAAWMVVGLLAFGGRAALFASFVALFAFGAWLLVRDAIGRRLTLARLGSVLIALAAGFVIVWIVLTQTTIADRIVNQDYADSSAQARVVEWLVPSLMNAKELMFGVSVRVLTQFIHQIGFLYPFEEVENFWLLAFLSYGLIGFAIYLLGFFSFLIHLWRRSPPLGRLMLVTLIMVASTSDSLGRKSNILFVLSGVLIATTGYADRREAHAIHRHPDAAPPSRPRALTPLAPLPGR
ncbi:MAG: VpsF family polysaccharide biosynthesis protein [Acidiphilium sp.]